MKIALIGYGKMGQMVEKAVKARGHEIVATIDPFGEKASAKVITKATLSGAEAAIEFTSPQSVMANIKALVPLGIPLVVGTTGWHDRHDEVAKLVEEHEGALCWAMNFSLGVNLFYKVVEKAAAIVGAHPAYDAGGYEVHHNQKADSPSGTARAIAERMLAAMPGKSRVEYGLVDRKPDPEEIHYASLRVGAVPGTHAVLFDSAFDTIELKHTARTREGFAEGAAIACEWIAGRKGMRCFDEYFSAV